MDIEEAKEQLLKHKKEIDVKFISARYSKAIEVVLSELEKKDKIINEILDYFQSGLSMCEDCENWLDNEHCKKCLKEHFTNKVEEDK